MQCILTIQCQFNITTSPWGRHLIQMLLNVDYITDIWGGSKFLWPGSLHEIFIIFIGSSTEYELLKCIGQSYFSRCGPQTSSVSITQGKIWTFKMWTFKPQPKTTESKSMFNRITRCFICELNFLSIVCGNVICCSDWGLHSCYVREMRNPILGTGGSHMQISGYACELIHLFCDSLWNLNVRDESH
jgi:hypothetical protein